MSEIKYTDGYVAFIDILGFSKFVNDEGNVDRIKDIIEFIGKFQYLFNSSPNLHTKVAFFSDSIIITTTKTSSLDMIFVAIWIAESYLYSKTGLLFRGGITRGKYYHEGSIAFGPAIVESYELENQANYSRIIIQNKIVEELEDIPFTIFRDMDDEFCFNPSSIGLFRNTPDGTKPTKEQFIKSFNEERKFILNLIKKNIYTKAFDKYLWRIKPFNFICEVLPQIFEYYQIGNEDEEINTLRAKKILLDNFLDLSIYD